MTTRKSNRKVSRSIKLDGFATETERHLAGSTAARFGEVKEHLYVRGKRLVQEMATKEQARLEEAKSKRLKHSSEQQQKETGSPSDTETSQDIPAFALRQHQQQQQQKRNAQAEKEVSTRLST